MFVFLIPRTPIKFRNEIRNALWELTKLSLLTQKSTNWKAIIISEIKESESNDQFIYIEMDEGKKWDKLRIALNYIENNFELKPDYLIRLDDDDLISDSYLYHIEQLIEKYDCYYDEYHTKIDTIYNKIACQKVNWIANTAIHKYSHAITKFGPNNDALIIQDHDIFWLQYYQNKHVYKSKFNQPIYYRLLTPYSITSNLKDNIEVNWIDYLNYLNGYGPWISIPSNFRFKKEIKELSVRFSFNKPKKTVLYWIYNFIKYYFILLFPKKTQKAKYSESIFSRKKKKKNKQECSKCILTTDDTEYITFNSKGVCNYCAYYSELMDNLGSSSKKTKWLSEKIIEIKNYGKNKPFDCIIGISGGVDSSYLALWAKENGLRPLLVHFDNGWNKELAVRNIESICFKLGFELQTIVIDWEEFKHLQIAYIKAGVVDIEVLSDHAIISTITKLAKKYKIKYILNGFNYSTEAIMPKGWVHDKTDYRNIKDINKKFGDKKIKTYPHTTFFENLFDYFFKDIEVVRVLNYIDHNKDETKKKLIEKLDWKDYGGKHYESAFTKFYQACILPTKFGIDKRKAHLSNLICSGQLTKEQAYEKLKEPLYQPEELATEKAYVLKKLGMREIEFDKLMQEKPRKHSDFNTHEIFWNIYFKIINLIRPWKRN